MGMKNPQLTDEQFRELCEKWIKASQSAIEAARIYGDLCAKRDQATPPYATEKLDTIWTFENQRDYLDGQCRSYSNYAREFAQEAAALDAQIRSILPPNIWYRVNGKGIMYQHGVATQAMDWEDVLAQAELRQ
jgi:hypothetical protein